MKRTPIRRVSKKQQEKNRTWLALVKELIETRADYACEIRHEGCWGRYNLSGHHIIRRARGRIDTRENCIIGCPNCHNHASYSSGIPISEEEALALIGELNKKGGD